jgi:hypothetical protein
MQRRGADYMAEWGKIMTGAAPKLQFLRPAILLPLAVETGRRLWNRHVAHVAPTIEYEIDGARTVWQPAPETALYPATFAVAKAAEGT